MSSINDKRPCALITGASRGIGFAIAQHLAYMNYELILVSSNGKALAEAADKLQHETMITPICVALDLTQNNAPADLFEQITSTGTQVDILVNNAGLGVYGSFAETRLDQELRMMQLNMQTLTALSKLFLTPMLERGKGHILNMASLTAYQPGGPNMAVYYASKSYVLSFTKALSVELRGTGIQVTAICPGPVASDFVNHSGVGTTLLYRLPKQTPEQIARIACKALHSRRGVIIPGFMAKLLAFAGELHPRRIALEINDILLK